MIRFLAGSVVGAIATKTTDKALQLGYRLIGEGWKLAVGRAIPSVSIPWLNPLYDALLEYVMETPEGKRISSVVIGDNMPLSAMVSLSGVAPSGHMGGVDVGGFDDTPYEDTHFSLRSVTPPVPALPSADRFHIPIKPDTSLFFFRDGKQLLSIQICRRKTEKKEDAPIGGDSLDYIRLSAYGWKSATIGVDFLREFIERVYAAHLLKKAVAPTISIYMNKNQGWSLQSHKSRRSLDTVLLHDTIVKDLITDMRWFRESEDWYRKRGIPYRRNYSLVGPPGSGKTSLLTAACSEDNRDIYLLSLAAKGMNDGVLAELLHQVPPESAIVLEDIESAFETAIPHSSDEEAKQRSYTPKPSITMQGMLQLLDGLTAKEGRVMFVTSNYPERLDPRLLRAGRVDRRITFGYATRGQVIALWERYFPELECRYGQCFADGVMKHPVVMAQVQSYLMQFPDAWEQVIEHLPHFYDLIDPVSEEQKALWNNGG